MTELIVGLICAASTLLAYRLGISRGRDIERDHIDLGAFKRGGDAGIRIERQQATMARYNKEIQRVMS